MDRPATVDIRDSQLRSTLSRLIDFDELNSGDCGFTATAVDLETGDDVVFDSRNRHINPVGGEDESRTSIDGNDDHRHDDQKPATGAGKNSADVTEDDPHKVEKLTKAGRDIDPDEGAD